MSKLRNFGLLVVLCSVLVTTAIAFDPTTQTPALLYDEALTVYYGNLARRAAGQPLGSCSGACHKKYGTLTAHGSRRSIGCRPQGRCFINLRIIIDAHCAIIALLFLHVNIRYTFDTEPGHFKVFPRPGRSEEMRRET